MYLRIYENYHTLSLHAADEIISQLKRKPDSVFCLAAGDTPRLAYNLLPVISLNGNVDLSRCFFVGLDEWIGIPPDNEGSCHFFLQNNLFKPLSIPAAQIHLFNALARDLVSECQRMDAIIREKGGIDLMLVGVGMNGHIGFNEPGVSEDLYSHVIELDETTRSVGQKYFKESTTLQNGITLGLQHFLRSKKVIMMASGVKKADVIRKSLEGPVTTNVPSSIVRKHANALVMLDKDAAASLA